MAAVNNDQSVSQAFSLSSSNIKLVSFNLHGYNQGSHVVRDLILKDDISVLLLQEHWLTPSNLVKFEVNFPQFDCFGCSAMDKAVEIGVLRGRPFGGLMTLVSKKLSKNTKLLYTSERCVVIAAGRVLIFNVYFPCNGTPQRHLICDELLDVILYWMQKYPEFRYIIGGDFNTCLSTCNPTSTIINQFLTGNSLSRCDSLVGALSLPTFRNDSQKSESVIDYFICSDPSAVSSFCVLDPCVNFSDHLPILINCKSEYFCFSDKSDNNLFKDDSCEAQVVHLRWDRGDILSYFNLTGQYLQLVYNELNIIDVCDVTTNDIDCVYLHIVEILTHCSKICVPSCKKGFFKFWWDQSLDLLKETSIESSRLWKASGRPRTGTLFDKYRRDKNAYRKAIRDGERSEKCIYSNDLHEALAHKNGTAFWKVWRAKFEGNRHNFTHVNGVTDYVEITDMFARHFQRACSSVSDVGADKLRNQYESMRSIYEGLPHSDEYIIDAELVDQVIAKLKRGKAAGLDSLTTEHLQFCYPLLLFY